ncbi:hypothetical protein PV04_07639 [Phialophora macrospora]|uniref:Uncharacterized protein n=1 Tax=Phialophora macrospora TaxID=1851006 RepID=A0A0D2FZR5_9EURO|nr:hypothetical protein PV04_07639 [Phialophora macrospora]
MRRCFEQFPSRSRTRNTLLASHLSSLRSGHSKVAVVRKTTCLNFSTRSSQTSFKTSLNNLYRDVSIGSRGADDHVDAKYGHRTGISRENRRNIKKPRRSSVEDCIAQLERYLPRGLSELDFLESRTVITGEPLFDDVVATLKRGRRKSGVNVLTFMVLHQRRHKAVVHLVEVLLKQIALAANEPFKDELPSNIDWPDGSFRKGVGAPIELERTLHLSRRPLGSSLGLSDYALKEDDSSTAMELVWSFLADVVLASSKQSPDERKQVMNTVHQILALIHKLGLVPANIYAHCPPRETTHVQRPPVLHLLNSKILSTLSDAVWHAYQDEVSARSEKGQRSPWNFFPEPPGSPLRSKGRELGPEVWIEFILWCCVEAGFASTGVRILKALRADVEIPWRAVPWTDGGVHRNDQNQMALPERQAPNETASRGELRTPAGTEYKFISAEVVLAVADSVINCFNSEAAGGALSVYKVQDDLRDLVSFLGPASVAPAYLDYLAVRLLQTELLYETDQVNALPTWTSILSHLRDLQPVEEQSRHEPGLTFDFILGRSELQAGILHQALQACIENNLVKKAVDTFTDIQKTVDGNKLQDIGEFLALSLRPEDGFFTSRLGKGQNEFLKSYGQLPAYKLAGFLDLVGSAKLFGLGDWLVFSDDIDGAALPVSIWGQPSIAAALTRYAAAKGDLPLLERVSSICAASNRKMTVNLLRSFVMSYISMREWDRAAQMLQELKQADGGGYSPRIVACLAATILRMEVDHEVLLQEDSESDLTQALLLFSRVLDGLYDSSAASFRIDQKKTFKQQVGYLLRLLENVADSRVPDVVRNFKFRFPVSNEPHLAPDTFNVVYAAIVETKGALESRNVWHLFCKDPRNFDALHDWQLRELDETMSDNEHIEDEEELLGSQTEELVVGKTNAPSSPDGHAPIATRDMNPAEPPRISMETASAAPTPLAYPSSLNIDSGLPQDGFGFPSSQTMGTAITRSDSSDIPIVRPDIDSDKMVPDLTQVVVPNSSTLQILVRQALSEIVARKERRKPHADLEEVIQWAGQFYDAFNLAPEDIRTEFRVSSNMPRALRVATKHRKNQGGYLTPTREKFRPDVSSQFSSAAFKTRLPGTPRVEEHAAHIYGAFHIEDGDEGDAGKETEKFLDQRTEHDPHLAHRFKVRKFGTSVTHRS